MPLLQVAHLAALHMLFAALGFYSADRECSALAGEVSARQLPGSSSSEYQPPPGSSPRLGTMQKRRGVRSDGDTLSVHLGSQIFL